MVELLRTARIVGLRRLLGLNRARRLGWEGIISGLFTTRTMNTLFNVGLFDEMMEKGRVNIESFAVSRGLDTRILKALCDSLYYQRILNREGLTYWLDPKGRLLVETARGWFDLIYGYEDILHNLEPLLRGEMEYGKDITRRPEFVAKGSGGIEAQLYFPLAMDMINRKEFKRVLDLGCGDATFLILLCQSNDAVTGYGVDISPQAIADAHRKIKEAGLQGRVHLFTEDIFQLERIADVLRGIDAATAFFVLHEFLFDNGDRVVGFLRNFGELFPGVPLILFEAIRPTPQEMRKRPSAPAIQYFLFHDLSQQNPVSREEWKALFSQAGFSSIGERYLGFARTAIYTLYRPRQRLGLLEQTEPPSSYVGAPIQTGGKRMKRILLVNPLLVGSESSFYAQVVDIPGRGTMGTVPPLGLATIAALTPDDIEVDLWDEAVNGQIEASTELKDYDLVGLTAYSSHLSRANEIGRIFRQRGVLTAIGGPGVSAEPERCRDTFDILFLGEAELTWPRFLAEWKTGRYRKVYRQVTKPDLALSPPPRWDSFNMNAYVFGVVQTTRGCPFDCEFCDVIRLFGRRSRHKPIDRILEEVATLERLGIRRIHFCDDNFIGVPRFAKGLLRELVALNRSFRHPVSFSTQLSINVAKDDEMLELLADADFFSLFIGIESPNKESLKEANKLQNYRTDLFADVRKIQSYGLGIRAAMIVGFDHDDTTIFDEQFRFLQEACTPNFSVTMLQAPAGTRLWARLCKEGRLVQYADEGRFSSVAQCVTNIIPKQMTRVELYAGYRSLIERLYDWSNFAARVKGMVSGIKRQPHVPKKRRWTWQDIVAFAGYVLSSSNKKARHATFSILWHTLHHTPYMLEKVGVMIAVHYREVDRLLGPVCEAIQTQIELETSEDFQLEIVQDRIVFPEPFVKFYREICPEIHQRVYQGLTDKARTNDVLIAVFTEFVVQGGRSFEQLEEGHKTFLYDLCDRTVARENSECYGPAVLLQDNEEPDLKGTDLPEGILQSIEQELRSRWRKDSHEG